MAWHGVLQLSAVFFTASIVSAQDCSTQQDTGPCLYFYENIHTAGICPKGIFAIFVCRGQVPADSSVDIRWYWTQNEDEAGTLGTLIQTDGSKYITMLQMDPPTNGRTIFFSDLLVHNFNDTDTGFYWCQMVINGSRLLEPSCPMEITAVPTNGTSAADICMVTGMTVPRKCADFVMITETSQFNTPTPSAPTAIMSESSLLRESQSALPGGTSLSGMEMISEQVTPTATPVPMDTGTPSSSSSSSSLSSAVYGALGAAAVVIVLVGGVLVSLLGWVYLKRKKLPSKTSPSTQTDDEDYSYPEPQTQGKDVLDRAGTGTYQTLELDSRDYTSMYCSLNPSTRQQTTPPTTERDGHVYAVADTHSTEPPHQYASLVLSQ